MSEPAAGGGEAPARAYREVTAGAVILGVIQGVLMTAAFTYIGLKLGFGLPGSTIAAITGFALLRGVGRGVLGIKGAGSIVENNINQTVASGVNTASAGVVFTFPALLLLGKGFSFWSVLLAAVAGSFMGIVIIIPLRKQLIEIERLKFPSGVAVATILKTPGAGMEKGVLLGVGFLVGAFLTMAVNPKVYQWMMGAPGHFIPEEIPIGPWLANALDLKSGGPAVALHGTAFYLSTASIGAGLLSGRGGLPFALGGVLAWWIVGPFLGTMGWIPPGPDGAPLEGGALAGAVYGQMLRPTGIGVLIGGALGGVVAAFPAIKGAISSLGAAARLAKETGQASEELSPRVLGGGLIASVLGLLVVTLVGAQASGGEVGVIAAIAAAIVGALWIALAGLIVAQATGATDISPLSGLALIAVTLMLAITSGNVVLAVTIGVAVCVATNQCADMMSDLKTGHLIGGVPRRQQLVQFGVAWIGPAVAIGTCMLLWQAGPGGSDGFGPQSAACVAKEAGCISAPQASVLQGLITGVLDGNAPVDKYLSGAAIGGALTLFPIGGLGVLVGLAMYLPFSITLSYGFGCVITIALEKAKGARFIGDKLIPVAAGLIVGEALTALTFTLGGLLGGS